ncbi:Thermostable dipeptidase. Metallo peptidase. MEROPS family M19 [Nostocoides japonicum T1-X7]|uniref:Thermostable dipeptidase. Metallo peptidase. MEROPS family M19 n=1 Tax=Nostocoides japonicum T1-X7 TaxID=1194083 RepID=A0A077LZR7_9MICO|nr:membrane dipeptidase [Tetrasphaera japonica]CCH77470.1 Thermostable dipeptidase. Metallo peptidase. MEROPS family M19 [Tetrasphaera japonica T1-X7]
MTAFVADCHNDLLLAVRHQRERGIEDPFGELWLPQLRAGGVRLQVLPVCTEDQFVGEGALRRSLLLIEEARNLAAVHSDSVAIVETGAGLREVLASGRIALVLAIEGAEPIGNSLELVDVMARAGIRMCSLSWNRRTMMADGIAERDTGGRLTQLGVDAVRRMEDIGVLVDVSHLSEAGFFHLADVATRPFIASHSSCRAVHDHPRNLTDDQLRVVCDTGGFVALNAFGPFLAETCPTVHHYVDHIEHAVSVVGPDRVGLGTDFIVDVQDIVDTPFTGVLVDWRDIPQTRDLQRPADFVGLAGCLRERVGGELAERILGANLADFLGGHLA